MHRPLATLAVVLLFACNKEEATGSAAPTASSSPPATGAPSAPSAAAVASTSPAASASASDTPPPKCPAGLTGNPMPAYCVKLPPGYSVKQSRISPTRGSIEYDTGSSTDNLMISYDESTVAQLSKDVESEMKFGGDKLDKKGNLPGGKWFQGTHAEYARIVTLFKGPGSLTLKCSFAYQPKKAPAKGAIDACKSIVIP